MGFSFFRQLQKRDRDFSVDVNGEVMPVKVVENDRAKRLTLRLLPSGKGLKVTTPSHVSDDEIESFVERNRNWAAAKLSRMPDTTTLEVGNTILYHGVDHKIISSGKMRGVVEPMVLDGENVLSIPGDPASAPRKLLAYLKKQARSELDRVVAVHAAAINVRPKRIRITDTTSRWGSCSTTRTLSFSWRIIMAPPEVLDYLAAHEVAHLVEMNHSANFWAVTKKLCPDTDTHKHWLKRHGSKLHAVAVP